MKSWFDEVEKICEKLKEKALICDSYSGIKKKLVLFGKTPIFYLSLNLNDLKLFEIVGHVLLN